MLIALLLFLTLALAILEVIIPSGGIIGVVAAVCAVIAMVVGFSHSEAVGWGVAVGLGAGLPAAIWLGFKLLPHTPFVLSARIEGHAKAAGLERYVGTRGIAETPLRPVGVVRIDGARLDAISEGDFIATGCDVEVRTVRSGELVVAPARARRSSDDGRE